MENVFIKLKKILKKPYIILIILLTVFIGIACAFLFQNLGSRPDITFINRWSTVITIVIVSIAVGYSTVIFQTVSNSKILTPGVLGLENIYMFIQTGLIFILGTGDYLVSTIPNFLLSVGVMIGFSLVLFMPMFSRKNIGIFFILLLGIVVGQMFSALTTYMQFFINPDEFDFIQGKMFASFENPNMYLVRISAILIGLSLLAMPSFKKLDVLSLGKDVAIGLGVNYRSISIRVLVIVSVLVAVSTVTVGPLMFLGVLVANLSYRIMKTYKHIYLIPACILVTALMIIMAQYFTKHIYNFGVTLSVLINFGGGIFFLYLLLKERKKNV